MNKIRRHIENPTDIKRTRNFVKNQIRFFRHTLKCKMCLGKLTRSYRVISEVEDHSRLKIATGLVKKSRGYKLKWEEERK